MRQGNFKKLNAIIGSDRYDQLSKFLENENIRESIGKWHEFDESLKMILLNESSFDGSTMEYHKKFSDIHLLLLGEDKIFLGGIVDDNHSEYNAEYDYALVKKEIKETILLAENHFVIIDRLESHSNQLKQGSNKAVIKFFIDE